MAFGDIAAQLDPSSERDLMRYASDCVPQRDGQIIAGRQGAHGVPKRMDLLRCRTWGIATAMAARPLEAVMTFSFLPARCIRCLMVMKSWCRWWSGSARSR